MRWLLAVLVCACEPTAIPPQAPLTTTPIVAGPAVAPKPELPRDTPVDVEWQGSWYPAVVLDTTSEGWLVHYDGYGDDWDEVVPRDRIRAREEAAQ